MTDVSFEMPIELSDQVCCSFYSLICASADFTQTVSKIAFAALAALAAGFFLGKSEFLNSWIEYALKDTLFSSTMFLQSLRGIIDFAPAHKEKIRLFQENRIDSVFDQKNISSLSGQEKLAGVLLNSGRGISEIGAISAAAVQLISCLALYFLSCENAQSMFILGKNSYRSLVHSIAFTGACFMSAAQLYRIE
jgi:hypothetical protein